VRPNAAITQSTEDVPAQDGDPPAALHLLAGRWMASCPTCGFQLASAQSQARCERRAARMSCPVYHEVP
jgi:hypothetical protein